MNTLQINHLNHLLIKHSTYAKRVKEAFLICWVQLRKEMYTLQEKQL
jgi:hypothetical protein